MFADIHALPSQLHRANFVRIAPDELAGYWRWQIDLVVNVSTDAAYHGGYTNRDGTSLRRLRCNDRYPLKPGEAFALTLGRLKRVLDTVRSAMPSWPRLRMPSWRRNGKADGDALAALEGVDGLEGSLDNLAHANNRTIMDAQQTSSPPMVVSHTGARRRGASSGSGRRAHDRRDGAAHHAREDAGYSDDEIDKVMGGNFFRL